MHLSPIIPPLVGIIFIILMLGLLLRPFRQPQLVGYIITGLLIGPYGLALVSDGKLVEELGGLGVTLLLFFIGMEVSPKALVSGWRIAIFGTILQIAASVSLTWLMGTMLGWSLARIILLGFVISLSSTAVVLKLLQDKGELSHKAGQNVLLILLAQDLAVVPMMIVISLLGSEIPSNQQLLLQLFGGALLLSFTAWLVSKEKIQLPLLNTIKQDHELQVFSAIMLCFGLAFISGMLQLSAALGAFIAGIMVATAKETEWVHRALEPLHVIFVALFFVSIGMLMDPGFLLQNLTQILLLVFAVLLSNTFINALILKLLGERWHSALYSGALLAQIGEFSYVLVAVGFTASIVNQTAYQLTISVISISLLICPAWIALMTKILQHWSPSYQH